MNTLIKHTFLNGWEASAKGSIWLDDPVVNVICTDTKGTLAALRSARTLARDLGARIQVLAAYAVPSPYPLDDPPATAGHLERILADVASRETEPTETTFHLYLRRDELDTLAQVLEPNSLVVIGDKRLWPNDASWIARLLRSIGHQVLFVRNKKSGNDVSPAKSQGDIARQEIRLSCAKRTG